MIQRRHRNITIISISHPAPCLCPRLGAPSPFPLSQAYQVYQDRPSPESAVSNLPRTHASNFSCVPGGAEAAALLGRVRAPQQKLVERVHDLLGAFED